MILVIIFPLLTLLYGFLTRAFTKPFPLGEQCPQCSMTPITRKTTKKKKILPMNIYNLAHFSIYNEQSTGKETKMTNIET